jgi:hypothetical protein
MMSGNINECKIETLGDDDSKKEPKARNIEEGERDREMRPDLPFVELGPSGYQAWKTCLQATLHSRLTHPFCFLEKMPVKNQMLWIRDVDRMGVGRRGVGGWCGWHVCVCMLVRALDRPVFWGVPCLSKSFVTLLLLLLLSSHHVVVVCLFYSQLSLLTSHLDDYKSRLVFLSCLGS